MTFAVKWGATVLTGGAMRRWLMAMVLAGCGGRAEKRPIEPVEPAPIPWPSQCEVDAVFAAQERARLEGLYREGFLIVFEGPGDEELLEREPVQPGGGEDL